MTYWNQRTAVLYLSESGREIFAQTANGRSLEVFVEWADDLGLWVFHGEVTPGTASVRLIKWSHFDSAVLDVIVAEPEPPKIIGFRSKHPKRER